MRNGRFVQRKYGQDVFNPQAAQTHVAHSFQQGQNFTSSDGKRRQLRWRVIPSPREWQVASQAARFEFMDRRSSPEMRAIDKGVADYELVALNQGATTAELFEAAVQLFEAIEVYLACKRGHKQKRVDAVRDLRAVTMDTLTTLRWRKINDAYGGIQKGLRPMVPHVLSEIHSPGHERVGQDASDVKLPDPWFDPQNVKAEKYLFQYLRRVRAENEGAESDSVQYIEDSDRWKYQVVFSETGLAYERLSGTGNLVLNQERAITTNGDNLGCASFACDEKGIFYTETSHASGVMNHCSYLRGKPVLCAGMIGINGGVIGYIDNGSGHYRPNTKDLVKCLKALREQMSPVAFECLLVGNHAGAYRQVAYLASKFLASNGMCMPIGYYEYTGRGTHYRRDLKEFENDQQLRDYVEGQDDKATRARLEAAVKKVITRCENARVKDRLTGVLANDEERRAMQAMLQFDPKSYDGLKNYFASDPPMLDWLKRNPLGYRSLHSDGKGGIVDQPPMVQGHSPAPTGYRRLRTDSKGRIGH
jgi:hypothetical protein